MAILAQFIAKYDGSDNPQFTKSYFDTSETSVSVSADAYISVVYLNEIAADAFVQQTYEIAASADGYAQKTFEQTVTADGYVVRTAVIEATPDALVRGTLTIPSTADAYVKQTKELSISAADAYLSETSILPVTADAADILPEGWSWIETTVDFEYVTNRHTYAYTSAVLQKTDLSILLAPSALVQQKAQLLQTTVNAELASPRTLNLDLDAVVGPDTYKLQATADSLLRGGKVVSLAGSVVLGLWAQRPQSENAWANRPGVSNTWTARAPASSTWTER